MQERTDKRARKELKTNDVMLIVQVLNVTMKQNCIPKADIFRPDCVGNVTAQGM